MEVQIGSTATLTGRGTSSGTSSTAARVLVVEDNPAMRRVLARILSSEWDTTSVSNGQEALDAFEACDFDVLVTDLGLPTMGGLTLAERIGDQWEDVPVILITGHPSIETAIGAVELHAFKYLTKPIWTSPL